MSITVPSPPREPILEDETIFIVEQRKKLKTQKDQLEKERDQYSEKVKDINKKLDYIHEKDTWYSNHPSQRKPVAVYAPSIPTFTPQKKSGWSSSEESEKEEEIQPRIIRRTVSGDKRKDLPSDEESEDLSKEESPKKKRGRPPKSSIVVKDSSNDTPSESEEDSDTPKSPIQSKSTIQEPVSKMFQFDDKPFEDFWKTLHRLLRRTKNMKVGTPTNHIIAFVGNPIPYEFTLKENGDLWIEDKKIYRRKRLIIYNSYILKIGKTEVYMDNPNSTDEDYLIADTTVQRMYYHNTLLRQFFHLSSGEPGRGWDGEITRRLEMMAQKFKK